MSEDSIRSQERRVEKAKWEVDQLIEEAEIAWGVWSKTTECSQKAILAYGEECRKLNEMKTKLKEMEDEDE